MEFKIDAVLPATAAQLWDIFFDVERVATLIPGCENVTEVEPLKEFGAVMKQKIGPFKLEVPTRIVIESHEDERQVVLVAAGSDKFTGTTLNVRMKVDLDENRGTSVAQCQLAVDASMQVAGRLASLGYPIVKKRSEDLFAEFERRLRLELAGFEDSTSETVEVEKLNTEEATLKGLEPAGETVFASPERRQPAAVVASQSRPNPISPKVPGQRRRVELVLQWPRVGISVATGIAVAHGAVAFGQSSWWWLVAPLLGVAAGLARRQD